MGARGAPDAPSSGAGADSEAGSTTSVCCWCDDYEKDIRVNSYGRYFRKYKADGSEYSYNFQKRYKILVPVKTGDTITVQIRFKVEPQSGVSESDVNDAKSRLESGVNTHWNGKYSIECHDPAPECENKTFTVRYEIVWVDSGEDYTMKVHETYAREGLSGSVMNVSKTTSAWIYAHEFAHSTGLPDEYSYSADTETVRYIKPDGSLDAAISAPPDGKSSTAPDATIMSSAGNTTTLERHCWNIAIETQALLRDRLGRDITCTVR